MSDIYGNLPDITVTVALVGALSGLLSAYATAKLNGLFNHQIKMVEYRNAYYQKLIDKRLSALDDLKGFLGVFKGSLLCEDDKTIRSTYYHTPFIYRDIADKFSNLYGHEMWLNDDAHEKFITFRDLFADIHKEIIKSGFDRDFIFEIGLENESVIYPAAQELYTALSKEYFDVHDFEPLKKAYTELRLPTLEWFQARKKQLAPPQKPQIKLPKPEDKSEKTE